MGIVVGNGQSATVPSGGTYDQTDVQSGGTLYIEAGGTADQTTIEGGGQVYDAGSATGVTGVNATLEVQSGGVASGVFSSRGYFTVDSGGQLFDTTLSGTIGANDNGGFLAVLNINPGGIASGMVLGQGGLVFDDGEAVNVTGSGRSNNFVDDGLLTYSGINAQVSASVTGYGLIETIGAATRVDITTSNQPNFFGTFTGAAVIGGGSVLELSQTDALGSGTVLFDPAGNATLEIEGNASPTETMANFVSGNQIILDGVSISGAQVSDGLVQLFLTNGGEDDISIADVFQGGVEITSGVGSTILTSVLVPTEFTSDSAINGNTDDFELNDGTIVSIGSGGTASNGYVGSAALVVGSSGSDNSTYVTSGGLEDVQSGGQSTNDHFQLGAQQTVESGGLSMDPVYNGGTLIDDGMVDFGVAGTPPVSATVYGLSGSGAINTTSSTLTLSGDASNFSGTVTAGAQGTVDVSDNALINAASKIDFEDPSTYPQDPTIEFDASLGNLPQATILGFATSTDNIDLRALSFAANTTSTPYSAYDEAYVTAGGSILEVISGGNSFTLNLDSATTGSGPLNLTPDSAGGTDISFSVLSAATVSALNSQLLLASTLSSGSYTVFLTSALTVTSGNGGTPQLDPLAAQSGGTVVLNGEGYGITPGGGGTTLSATAGPLVVTSLGGGIGLEVTGGAHLTVTSNSFGGGVLLNSGILEVADSAGAGTGSISFSPIGGGHQSLQFDEAAQPTAVNGIFNNVINDFGMMAQQYIDLAGFAFDSGMTSATLSLDGSTLMVTDGGNTVDFSVTNAALGPFNTFDDGNGGTIVTADQIACYVTGTLILTETGERPVETLAIGERVVTAGGRVRPIRWIGRRGYSNRFLSRQPSLWPVCVRAGALAHGVPARDLTVSPRHALLLDGVLVPAALLVNGRTVVQALGDADVSYWHIELDEHDVLLAEGAAAEAFVDDDSRMLFQNAAEHMALYPDAIRGAAHYCAPRVEHGWALEAIRGRLAARGARMAA